MMRKSGAAQRISASVRATSSVTTAPVGFAWVGTTHMPLICGSSATRPATTAVSGPSWRMGTGIISMP